MESRALVDMQNQKGGSLVAPFTYTQPLLPYERQLIEVLGISEQEYRQFASEVTAKGYQRPEAYDHVPDIRCEPFLTPIIVSLVVGAIFTGVGMLLAPKPPKPEDAEETGQKNFGDQQGRTRFNSSVGFDSAAQLAQLGSRIPLIFGRFIESKGNAESGGIVVEPLMVWSRMFSNGSFQTIEAMMVIGNSTISKKPELDGIMIGGTAMANIYRTNYAISYKSSNGKNRLFPSDVIYGDATSTGNQYGLFVCPTATGSAKGGFCMTYTPTNTTTFGVYEAIPNGGRYSVNWRVISILKQSGSDDPKGRLKNERRKIAGTAHDSKNNKMGGQGRFYSPKCGVIGSSGGATPGWREYKFVIDVNIGDTVTYRIDGSGFEGECGFDGKSEVTATDIDQAVNGIRDAADAALQVDEVFMMNRTLLRVKSRPNDVWRPGKTQDYILEVIEFLGTNRKIGGIGWRSLQQAVLQEGDGKADPRMLEGTAWYCLTKPDLGQVKNTRPCDVTEIGLRSQVWARANGLCNFPNVPTPDLLRKYEDDRISLNAGTQSQYMYRSTFFLLGVKDVKNPRGLDPSGKDTNPDDATHSGFDTLSSALFCVRGNIPVDVYNYIRVKHPKQGEYEFRLVPLDHTHIFRYVNHSTNCYVLNISGPHQTVVENTAHYGTFKVEFQASKAPIKDFFELEELYGGGRRFEGKAQIKEFSCWTSVTRSCDTNPEHAIVYVNESRDNDSLPTYSQLTTMGIKLRSLNQVQSFSQIQVWLANGMNISRYIEKTTGPSNNLSDIVNYLLSNHIDGSGVGGAISSKLIDQNALKKTAHFLAKYNLRFDGAISDSVNIRSYLTTIAPLYLCNFVIGNGKFSLIPGLPVDNKGEILTSAVPITQYFNDANIIAGSFNLEFVPQVDRMQFRAVMKYRNSIKNSLTESETIMVKWSDAPVQPPPQEDYDMTAYCTQREHAFMSARYLMSLRRRVDHTVTFKTLPDGLKLAPGDYIRFDTNSAPYRALYSGVIRADGTLLCVSPPPDGTYDGHFYLANASSVTDHSFTILNGKVVGSQFYGALFNIPNSPSLKGGGSIPERLGVYLVEQITLGEDALVEVVASHFPVDQNNVSKIVNDVLDKTSFEVIT